MMNTLKRLVISAALLMVCLLIAGCGKAITPFLSKITATSGEVKVITSIVNPGQAGAVSRINIRLSNGSKTLTDSLPYSGGDTSFSFKEVSAGSWSITAEATNYSNMTLYQGESSVNISGSSSKTVRVSMTAVVTNFEIAFSSNRSGSDGLWVMNSNGTNVHQLSSAEGGLTPKWSPVGNKIVYVTEYHNNANDGDIHIINVDNNTSAALASTWDNERYPTWSPDGQYIVYAANRGGNWELDRISIQPESTYTVLASSSTYNYLQPNWAAVGNKIAFVRQTLSSLYGDIYTMSTSGTNILSLVSTSFDERQPVWSPDGTKLLYTTNKDGNYEIYMINANGTSPQRLTNNSAVDCDPAWAANGTRILFTSNRDDNAEVYSMDLFGGNVTRLTTHSAYDGEPAASM